MRAIAWLGELARRLRMLFRGRRFDRELEEELRLHHELRAGELEAAGLAPDAARRAAERRVGNALRLREDSRDAWGWSGLEHALRDVRHGLRLLARSPGFTLVAVATLALGIGGTSAMFTVVDRVLLAPLPYPEPDRLVRLRANQSVPDLDDVRRGTRSYAALAGIVVQALDYTGETEPIQVQGGLTSAELFAVLGTSPALGRAFTAAEDVTGGPRVVVLTDEFWRRHFGADPDVLGRTMPLSGESYTVVGVMPPGFWMPDRQPDLLASVRVVNPVAAQFRGVHFLETFGRLAADVTLAQARAELAGVDEELARRYPDENTDNHRVVQPLLDSVVAGARPAILILFGAVALVLLIASVNFANLLLARAAARRRELVIRAALGAGARRLVGQMLVESVLLALLGGLAGLVLARWGLDLLLALKPAGLPRLGDVGLDLRVLGFTLALSLATGVLFGLVPALGVLRLDVNEGLYDSGRGSPHRQRLRRTLVVAETALALVLLVGAGLLVKSFSTIATAAPGFDPAGLVTMRLELPESRYRGLDDQRRFRARLVEALNALPGVQAAMVSELPMGGEWLTHNFVIEGRPPLRVGTEPDLLTRTIAGDYFRVMGIPLRAGRGFSPADDDRAPPVVVVNEAFARRYFPDADPLGARIRWARGEPTWMTIVGVVGDVRHFGLDKPEQPAAYDLYAQTQQPWKRWMAVVLKSSMPPAEVLRTAKERLWTIDGRIPPTKVQTMAQVMAGSLDMHRFALTLMSVFAAVALLLAAIGLYGVTAYGVTQRFHEFGIRMALGARRGDIARLVIGEGGRLVAAGAALGAAGALALTRLMSSLVVGVSVRDPLIFAGVAVLLAAVAALACWLPARRAGRVEPIVALRNE